MEKLIKNMLLPSLICMMFILVSGWSEAAKRWQDSRDMVEGSVQGFTCVTQGKLCPVGMEDPMAAAERVFVVLTKGKEYYFVPNVDRAVMARHINDRVRFYGKLNSRFNAIEANQIDVFKRGAWRTTWTFSWQQRMDEDLKSY
jgi:hypothetical protein